MSGLHEAIDNIAAEITPVDPPVDLTMLRGRKMRNRRRATVISGTAGAMALVAAAAVGIPALASRPAHQGGATAPASGAPGTAKPFISSDVLMARPVLLYTPLHSASRYGDATKVNAATMKLFDKLVCRPGPNAYTVNESWKATVGYSATPGYDDLGGQIVSCDASGGKYVLDKPTFESWDITSVSTGPEQSTQQWVVDLTLNRRATAAFATLTTNQYNTYYSGYQSGNEDDAVLDQIAVVLDGNVQSAPETGEPITDGQIEITGPQAGGFTQAQARAFAAHLAAPLKAQAHAAHP